MKFESEFEELNLPIYGVRLPEFKITEEYKREAELEIDSLISNFDFLRGLCLTGFKVLNLQKNSNEYIKYVERAKYELSIMKELGYTDYILLVWDVINFCKKNKIPTGLGRGSAAGSLVLFLIGVTKIDPIKYGLYFERFISKIRAKKQTINGIDYLDGSLAPDIDIDICYYNRPKVLQYLEQKFKGKTSKILTFNTLSAKLLIKECGKIIGSKSEEEMSMVTSLIPKIFGKVEDLEDAYEGVAEFKKWADANPKVYKTALKLRDLIKNKGVHPSGISLSYEELEGNSPTELSSDGDIVSSYDMNWVSMFNVKLDALGLRGVSVVDRVCKMLGIEFSKIDLNHPSIYQNLYDLKRPHGLFQIEADLAFKVTQKVKPKSLEELSAVLALARPGAMAFVDKYANYVNNGIYEPIHPFFDDILKPTGGVALYQEQLMQMAHKIGFTLDEAEILRRIVGKKKVEEAKAWKEKIANKVKEKNIPSEVSDVLWKILEDSANYSFNKSHSCAYAALAATTVYLKFNHPKEFFLALLQMSKNEPDPIGEISVIQKEMSHFNLKLLPPHLQKSEIDFSIESQNIRFGLSSIKGVSEKTIEKLLNFKSTNLNKLEMFEAAKEAGLTIGVLCALIQAGALEDYKYSRVKTVYEAQLWNVLTEKEKSLILKYASQFDFELVKTLRHATTLKNEKGKLLIKESRVETIREKSKKYKTIYEQNILCERFANWWYENLLLGYASSCRLIDIFQSKIEGLTEIGDVVERDNDSRINFIGKISEEVKRGVSRTKGSKYATMLVADESGSIKTMIFNKKLEECESLNTRLPKEGDIVIVKGTKKDGAVFADLIAIQQNKIYTKLSDVKNQEGE
jgi:DNA-directed DNA polymerase III PolC